MVDITCTRCNATGNNYPTNYVAKFSLVHERGCGVGIGIPKFSVGKKPTLKEVEPVIHNTDHSEQLFSDVVKTKKKKTSKKK